jgi:hypothetical protein
MKDREKQQEASCRYEEMYGHEGSAWQGPICERCYLWEVRSEQFYQNSWKALKLYRGCEFSGFDFWGLGYLKLC